MCGYCPYCRHYCPRLCNFCGDQNFGMAQAIFTSLAQFAVKNESATPIKIKEIKEMKEKLQTLGVQKISPELEQAALPKDKITGEVVEYVYQSKMNIKPPKDKSSKHNLPEDMLPEALKAGFMKVKDPEASKPKRTEIELITTGPCQYCQYCRFCKDCEQCPCDDRPNCKFCKYCTYCTLCNACSMCAKGGAVDIIADGLGSIFSSFGFSSDLMSTVNEEELNKDIEEFKKNQNA